MNTQSLSTTRWILFIPVAFIVSYIAFYLFDNFVMTVGFRAALRMGQEMLLFQLAPVVSGVVNGATFFAVGIILAPQPKNKAALWLAAAGVVILLIKLQIYHVYSSKLTLTTIGHYGAYLFTLVLGLLLVPKPKPTLEQYLAQMKEEDSRVLAGNKVG